MQHRHLNHRDFTLAGIDDVISRGRRADWEALRRAMLDDSSVVDRVEKVCSQRGDDPRAQRHQFWKRYVEERRTA